MYIHWKNYIFLVKRGQKKSLKNFLVFLDSPILKKLNSIQTKIISMPTKFFAARFRGAAPVARPGRADRPPASGAGGPGFESCQVSKFSKKIEFFEKFQNHPKSS